MRSLRDAQFLENGVALRGILDQRFDLLAEIGGVGQRTLQRLERGPQLHELLQLGNLVADVLLAVTDPRIRFGH